MFFGCSLLLLAIAYITFSSAIPVPNVDEELSSLVTREPSSESQCFPFDEKNTNSAILGKSKKVNQVVKKTRNPAKPRHNWSKQKKEKWLRNSGGVEVEVPPFIY